MTIGKLFRLQNKSRSLVTPCLLVCLIAMIGPSESLAEVTAKESNVNALGVTSQDVVVGIDGHYRVGMWTAVRCPESVVRGDGESESYTIETLDGDGVRVSYDQAASDQAASDQADGALCFGYAVPGSEAAPLVIQGNGQRIVTRFPDQADPGAGASMIPATMPWIVVIGDTLGLETIGASEVLKRRASVAVTVPKSVESLPDHSMGYQGVDLMVINQSGLPLLEKMTTRQQVAITEWIKLGGRLLLTLGASTPQVKEASPWLFEMIPLDEINVVRLDPASVETLVSSQSPLRSFTGVELPRRAGKVLLTGRNSRRILATLAAEYPVGFGRIAVISADLDEEPFADWPDRLELVQSVVKGVFPETGINAPSANRTTSFNDLAGQMRATLDQFVIKRSFSFSFLAIILLMLIAAVGPIDYLLINRVWGKPLLGWVSLPLMLIGLSGLLIMQSRPALGELESTSDSTPGSTFSQGGVAVNQLQILDVDAIDGVGRGLVWSFLYSHDADQYHVEFDLAGRGEEMVKHAIWTRSTPYGYPGNEFGGIQLAGENTLLPRYDVQLTTQEETQRYSVGGLAVAPRSSKSLASQMRFEPAPIGQWSVYRRPGSEQLRGELVNPLPVDLVDGMLIYGDNVYMLPNRLKAGARIPTVDKLRQRNLRRRLARQQALEKNVTETELWVPGRLDAPGRVAEMLMFHDAAGGSVYTGLTHLPLANLDLSHVLMEDRCLLVGRTDEPLVSVNVRRQQAGSDGEPIAFTGRSLSLIRVLLPLETKRVQPDASSL